MSTEQPYKGLYRFQSRTIDEMERMLISIHKELIARGVAIPDPRDTEIARLRDEIAFLRDEIKHLKKKVGET